MSFLIGTTKPNLQIAAFRVSIELAVAELQPVSFT